MQVILFLMLCSLTVQTGDWVVVTPDNQTEMEQVACLVDALRDARKRAEVFLGLDRADSRPVTVRIAPTSGDFAAWTGCSIWQGGALRNGELVLQPLAVLESRGVTGQVLTHECCHLLLSAYNPPSWLDEGLAVLCADQVKRLSRGLGMKDLVKDTGKIKKLLESSDTLELRRGYLSAAGITEEILEKIGLDSLICLIKEEAL